jgi:hypothetical protein
MSKPSIPDKFGNVWQYHSRSDRHSKVACWGIALDLLASSSTLQRHVVQNKVTLGVNHEMRDFATNRKKDLDLVFARPATAIPEGGRTFADLAERWQIELDDYDRALLDHLPVPVEAPVGAVLVALEAKACMTAHVKSLPRLYDELNSSHLTVHGASENALAVGFVMVNLSTSFRSPGLNSFDLAAHEPLVSTHAQPHSTVRVLDKIAEMPRRTKTGQNGFDGLGVVVVESRNDGSPVELIEQPPAPAPGSIFHYDTMISRMANEYDVRFKDI